MSVIAPNIEHSRTIPTEGLEHRHRMILADAQRNAYHNQAPYIAVFEGSHADDHWLIKKYGEECQIKALSCNRNPNAPHHFQVACTTRKGRDKFMQIIEEDPFQWGVYNDIDVAYGFNFEHKELLPY